MLAACGTRRRDVVFASIERPAQVPPLPVRSVCAVTTCLGVHHGGCLALSSTIDIDVAFAVAAACSGCPPRSMVASYGSSAALIDGNVGAWWLRIVP